MLPSTMLEASGFPADATAVFELPCENLGDTWSKVAENLSCSQDEREAARKLVLASNQARDDDYELALISAREAADKFKAIQHRAGLVDAERLLVHLYCVHAVSCRYAEGESFKSGAKRSLIAAESLATVKAAEYKAAGDVRGEASLLLAQGEIGFARLEAKCQHEAENLATSALKLAREASDLTLEAACLLLLASIAVKLHNTPQAAEHASAARSCFQKTGDSKGAAKALHLVGVSTVMKGNLEEGFGQCMESALLFRKLEEKKYEAFVYFHVAQLFIWRRMGKDAADFAEDALAIFRAGSKSAYQAQAASLVVQANILKGDSRQALRIASECLDHFRTKQYRRGEALMLAAAAKVHISKEDFAEAHRMLDEAQGIIGAIGDKRWEGALLCETVYMNLQKRAIEDATAAASEAASVYQSAGDRLGEAYALAALLDVHVQKGDFYASTQAANEQRAIFQEIGDRSREASSLLAAARGLCGEDSLDQALVLAEEAREMSEEIEDRSGEAQALAVLAEIHSRREDLDPAVEAAKEMKDKAKAIGDRILEAQACKALANVYQTFENIVAAVRAANEAVSAAKKSMHKPIICEMMLLASKMNMSLVLEDGAQVSIRGAEKAMRPAREAVTVAKATGKNSLISGALYQLAEVQLMSYQLGLSMASTKEALEIFRKVEDRSQEAAAVILMAECHYAGGKHEKAEETAREGIQLAAACGDVRRQQYGQALLQQINESREAMLQRAKPHMVPMQMMPQALAAPAVADAGAPAAEVVSVAAPKQVGLDRAMVQQTVQDMARQAIGVDDELYLDSALMDSGMDSLTAVSFRNGLQQNLGVKLPSSLMFDYPTMKEVANRIVELSIENA
eukprot:TRINITY_DN23886_c0_g1_i1.p1 TRINITY_DN23886_c0_g1~~TRINITY_DN23886_c0_g1_i1.p1  ORF type:complete len:896 (+),score=242.74 TRINITY_DN23886_c0_g1_i1:117-2690(+)